MIAAGMIITWVTKSLGMISSAGNSPPNTRNASHVPISGIEIAIE
jgi:hypothetical protein